MRRAKSRIPDRPMLTMLLNSSDQTLVDLIKAGTALTSLSDWKHAGSTHVTIGLAR